VVGIRHKWRTSNIRNRFRLALIDLFGEKEGKPRVPAISNMVLGDGKITIGKRESHKQGISDALTAADSAPAPESSSAREASAGGGLE
jgi:hypothetical protein